MGVKSTGAVFVKVLQSRTVEDHLIERFDLRKRYGMKYWEDARKKLDFPDRRSLRTRRAA